MNVSINKDTKIYCSFSKTAGNKGCEFFNKAFAKYNIDALYKSFSINNINDAYKAALCLKFSGCAIAMPFKKQACELVSYKDESAELSKSVNTIIFDHNTDTSIGYNTDYYATGIILKPYIKTYKIINILGNGGLSTAVQAKCRNLGFEVNLITRENWNTIKNLKDSLIFNCTPFNNIEVKPNNVFIDCIIGTSTGDEFHKYQSHKQFTLYTDLIYEV